MFTQEILESKSGPELVAIFNDLPNTASVKRFTNKETAVKRILGALITESTVPIILGLRDKPSKRMIVPLPTESGLQSLGADIVEGAGPKRGRKKQTRGTYNLEGKGTLRNHRPSSGRGRLVAALFVGRTFEQLLVEFPMWEADRLHKTIHMVNNWLGYAFTTSDEGVITIQG